MYLKVVPHPNLVNVHESSTTSQPIKMYMEVVPHPNVLMYMMYEAIQTVSSKINRFADQYSLKYYWTMLLLQSSIVCLVTEDNTAVAASRINTSTNSTARYICLKGCRPTVGCITLPQSCHATMVFGTLGQSGLPTVADECWDVTLYTY